MVNAELRSYWRGALGLLVMLKILPGCAAEPVRVPAVPARTLVQGVTRVEEMRTRADRMLEEMRTTQEELKHHLQVNGAPTSTCPSMAVPTVDVIVADAVAKRNGLEIPPSDLRREKDLGPYKTDFGAIAEAADRLKDIAAACGLTPAPPPPPRSPAPLVITGIGAGLGVAGLVVGGVLGNAALEKRQELIAACPNKKCPSQAKHIAETADGLAAGSTAAFIAGGSVLALSGIPLIIYFSPSTSKSPQVSFFLFTGRFQ